MQTSSTAGSSAGLSSQFSLLGFDSSSPSRNVEDEDEDDEGGLDRSSATGPINISSAAAAVFSHEAQSVSVSGSSLSPAKKGRSSDGVDEKAQDISKSQTRPRSESLELRMKKYKDAKFDPENPREIYEIIKLVDFHMSQVKSYDAPMHARLMTALKAMKHFDFTRLGLSELHGRIVRFARCCPAVESINAQSVRFIDQTVLELQEMTGLKTINIVSCGSKAVKLKISCFPKLENLSASFVDDGWLKDLAGCRKLTVLNLPDSECTAIGLEYMLAHPALKELHIRGNTHITIKDIESLLSETRTIRLIDVRECPQVDEAFMPKVREAFKDVKILTSLDGLSKLTVQEAAPAAAPLSAALSPSVPSRELTMSEEARQGLKILKQYVWVNDEFDPKGWQHIKVLGGVPEQEKILIEKLFQENRLQVKFSPMGRAVTGELKYRVEAPIVDIAKLI